MVLDNLETETEREGKSDDHQTPGGDNQQPTTKSQTCSVVSGVQPYNISSFISEASPDDDLVGDEPEYTFDNN